MRPNASVAAQSRVRSFTLLELVAVVVIIGLLAAIAVVGFRAPIERANEAAVRTTAEQFDRAYRALLAFDPTVDPEVLASQVASEFPADRVITGVSASSGVFIDISWAEFSEVTFVAGSAVSVLTLPESTDEPVGDRLITGKVTSDVRASGGDRVYTISVEGNLWRVHEFRTVGESQFVVPDGETLPVEYLVVGGGGSGGQHAGGGGGAGGFVTNVGDTPTALSGSTQVTVGAGGEKRLTSSNRGLSGAPSSFGQDVVALGGGGGGGRGQSGLAGASGGGGSYGHLPGGVTQGLGTQGQGNDGGLGTEGTNTNVHGGGGGGAGGPGEDGVKASVRSGDGGPGLPSSITGVERFYAGGGGGSAFSMPRLKGLGGIGGGGDGAQGNVWSQVLTLAELSEAKDGEAGSGGGGGGSGPWNQGGGPAGSGGSGIVIVRYQL